MDILHDITPELLDWSAKSPVLSPIEQLCDYMKRKLAGVQFKSPEELYERISEEWEKIPSEIIDHYYSCFQALYSVCINHNGNCLNGHWNEVSKVHSSYGNAYQ